MSDLEKGLESLRIERDDDEPPRRAWLPWVILGVVVVAAAVWWFTRPTAVAVQTDVVRERRAGAASTVLDASGYVTARLQATVSSKVTGKVVEVLIEEGMEVQAGDVLARLDPVNAEAGLALARAQATSAERGLAETEVRLAEAQREAGRQERLVGAAVASPVASDRARAEADALTAALERQRSEVEVGRRQVALARQALEDTVIRAPFAGRVVAKNAQPGEMISPMSAGGFTRTGIGTIVDMSSLEIEVDVNESYINRVRPGQVVEARLNAYSDWPIPARVIAIIPTADRDRATVKVRIGFDALDERILPDMGVKVAFRDDAPAAVEGTVLWVPGVALRRDGESDVVFVVADGRVERRAVRAGAAEGDGVRVLAGLAAGERVVVGGPEALADGDSVQEEGR